MADKKDDPLTLDKVSDQYGKISEKSKALVEFINSNFAGLKINTEPLEKFSSVMSKMKTVLNAVGLPKYTLDTIHATSEVIANTVATEGNIKEKIKDTATNLQLIGIYVKDNAALMAKAVATKAVAAAQKVQAVATKAVAAAQKAQAVATKAIAVEQKAQAAATQIAATAQKLFNAAMSANPIGIVITLIVLLVAAIVILWNKNAAFRDFITGMYHALVALVQTVVSSIRTFFAGLWSGIVAIFTPVGAWFAGVFNGAWNNIRNAFAAAVEFFRGVWGGITGVFSQVGGWFANVFNGAWNSIRNAFAGVGGLFQSIWGSIVGIFSSIGAAVGNAIGGAFRNVVNSIIGFAQNIINGFLNDINFAIGVIDHIPGVSISKVPLLSLPRLAGGGITNGTTIAMIGEAGREAVLPLQSNTGWMDTLAGKIAAQLSTNSVGSGNSGGGMDGRAPRQAFEEEITVPLRKANPLLLLELFKRTSRLLKVGKNGIRVPELGQYYDSNELSRFFGKQVYARYRIDDVRQVYCCDEEGRFLCMANSRALGSLNQELTAQNLRQMNSDRKQRCKAARDYKPSVSVPSIEQIAMEQGMFFDKPNLQALPSMQTVNSAQQERAAKAPDFCAALQNTHNIIERVRISHIYGDIVLIYDTAGCGKSTALKHYAAENNGVVYVEANVTTNFPRCILKMILKAMGQDVRGTSDDMMQRIVDTVSDTNMLLIIDEAQQLAEKSFDALRAINDKAHVGIVYSGNPGILKRMYGRQQEDFDQLYSRIAYRLELQNNYTLDDIAQLYAGSGISNGCLRRLLQIAQQKGGLWVMVNRCKLAQNFAMALHQEFTELHLEKAAAQMGSGGNAV